MWTSTDDAIPFDRVAPEAIEPAVLAGMTAFRDELAAIANSPDAPTFANTIAALDNAGRTFNRASSLLSIHTSTLATPAMQATEARLAPVLAAFGDELIQNAALFARIRAVHDAGTKDLAPDEARLVELTYQSFARNGAALNDADKARMAAINQRLAVLFTTFSQKLLADEESQSVVLDDGSKIANTRSAVEPFLTYSTRRDLRERVWRMFVERGDASMIPEILALRNEKAKLLGFPTFAHWVLDDKMAKTPEAALELMMSVWPAARDRAREEVRDMEKLAGHPIEPWDYRFYAEKVRKERYEIDEDEVKNYFQLDNMREGMFWAAQQLYGLDFTRIDVPVYHPDVTVYEVTRGRGADRARVGLWYFDPFARDGKRSGAWMDEWRAQERYFTEQTPIVTNVANFLKPASGPTLISFDDARTLFHEFGHALHGLSSNVRFPGLAGTRVLRDFVEFPSQINERW
ncbi:MAG TPA: M3 family metallopeptidase, partial [Kofleriaceae bacterium]|nr:M3 family metallopeptidase [Kofleriaceae bacterium]